MIRGSTRGAAPRPAAARAGLALAAAALLAAATPAAAAPVFTRVPAAAARTFAVQARPGGALLAVDGAAVAAFRAAGGGALEVPLDATRSVTLQLTPYNLLAPGASLTTSDARGRRAVTPDLTLFRGTVAGDSGSWAVVGMTPQGVMGTVEMRDGRWSLMPTRAAGAGGLPLHAFAPEASLDVQGTPFICGINDQNEARYVVGAPPHAPPGFTPGEPRVAQPGQVEVNAARSVFDIAVDCDYELYANKFGGNLAAEQAYVLTVLATVSLIYERDVEATLRYSYVNFWTTSSDPYSATTLNGALIEMQTYWDSSRTRTGVSRAVAHLISGKSLGGGIGYIGVLCNTSAGYSVSAIDAIYSYPTNTTTWDVEVIAHELGHNFGSFHTHSCFWQANGYLPAGATIDTCQAAEPYNNQPACNSATPRLPPDKGTIMSYCHLISSVATGLRLDFHPLCITVMRQSIAAAPCSSLPTPAPPRNPLLTATATGAHLSWTAGGSSGVLGYDVYRSRTQLDLNPARLAHTTGLSFDDAGIGTYYYKVKAVRAADTSSFSAETHLSECPFTGIANAGTGSLPSAVVTGDFNHDGITDLAIANTGAGTVTILLGQGSGGIGNGSFTAASFATGPQPACIAADDVNGDGILDLLVGTQGDNSIHVHLGNGAGGVGNGTFAAGVAYPCGVPASGLAVADLDEDGYDDLAVAGGATQIAILKGRGTGGVPDGTFGPDTLLAAGSSTHGILAADFNGDGIWDLAVTGTDVRILLGNGSGGHGDGTFAPPVAYPAGASPNHMAIGDFNLDGKLDLAVCNAGASSVSILLGVGDGTFQPTLTAVSGQGPNGVSVGDWNQDGVPDLAIGNNSPSKTASILLGHGDGTFEPAQAFAVTQNSPSAVALGDFNHDGGVDMFVLNRGSLSATRMLAGCTPILSGALHVTAPGGGEQWIGNDERTIAWTKGSGVMGVDVQLSRDGGATWHTLAAHLPGTQFTWTVTGAYTTHARVRVVDSDRAQFADTTAADFTIIPISALGVSAGPARLALGGAWPNPARGDLAVGFTLPADGPATLELLDLAGRRVAARDVGALGAGAHRVTLLAGARLAPGVYVVRLTRGRDSRALKVAVVR